MHEEIKILLVTTYRNKVKKQVWWPIAIPSDVATSRHDIPCFSLCYIFSYKSWQTASMIILSMHFNTEILKLNAQLCKII